VGLDTPPGGHILNLSEVQQENPGYIRVVCESDTEIPDWKQAGMPWVERT
jgi:hypothetical protein